MTTEELRKMLQGYIRTEDMTRLMLINRVKQLEKALVTWLERGQYEKQRYD